MLEGMRRASKSWLGKVVVTILFGILILSFAIWGIGDIFRGIGVSSVAKVGDVEISTETYRTAYQTQLQNLQRETRRAITADQARAAGVDRAVLSRLITDAALDQRAKTLGLAMAERDIAQAIVNDPTFHGATGQFDRQRFNEALREAGYPNEQRFVQEQRLVYVRRELALSIAGEAPAPKILLEAVHQYDAETRSVEFFVLPAARAEPVAPPSEAALGEYFEANKFAFRAPEYRRVTILSASPAAFADPSRVSDADARALYEQTKARFSQPERREVQQIVYPNEEEARAAFEKAKGGESFVALAAARGLSEKDVSLGLLTWGEFADPNVAQAAFALKDGETGEPLKTAFGFTLLRVNRVEPQSTRPFEEVAENVKRELAERRARDETMKARDRVEDQRTSGKTLAEAAGAAGLQARVIEAIDQLGQDREGAPVPDLPEREDLLRAIFASDIGVDNDVLNTRDNGYVWFEIAAIDPARERTLAEVRERVVKAWTEEEVDRVLQRKAGALVARIEAGESVEAAAKIEGLSAQVAADVKRGGSQTLPPAAIARVFSVAPGAVASAASNSDRVIFKVVDSVTPPFDPDSALIKAIGPRLREAITEDILQQFVVKTQEDLGVRINEAAVRMAVGGEQN